MAPRLTIEKLNRSFDGVPAIVDLSFEVPAGSFVTLLGPSGCGKSTTLRCLAGLEQPDSGVIKFGDRVIVGPDVYVPANARGAGMVFQSYAVWPHMRVFDNIAYGLTSRGVRATEVTERVERIAEMIGIGKLLRRYPSQLSGGQQQRVALARSLVYEPEVLLLDEPLSNLDAQLRNQMRFELAAIQQRLGTSTVYVTHSREEALVMSDYILLMHDGRAVQFGTPEELYQRPTSRFAADFLGDANFFEGRISARGNGFAVIETANGLSLRTNATTPDLGVDVLAMVRPHQVAVASDSNAADNSIPANVDYVAFLGERREVWLKAAGTTIRAVSDRSFQIGDKVHARIRSEDVVIIESGSRDVAVAQAA